jgi:hypothetical protein
MTASMVAFGVTVPLFGRLLPRKASIAAVAAGLGTLAVAAFPLDPGESVPAHAAAAGFAYVATSAMPALSGNVPLGAVSLALLTGSVVFHDSAGGLLQRAGLTLVDAWIVLRSVRAPATPTR